MRGEEVPSSLISAVIITNGNENVGMEVIHIEVNIKSVFRMRGSDLELLKNLQIKLQACSQNYSRS